MLVVNVYALCDVDALNLADQVTLGLGAPTQCQKLCWIERALVELTTSINPLALFNQKARALRERVVMLIAVLVGDGNDQCLLSALN